MDGGDEEHSCGIKEIYFQVLLQYLGRHKKASIVYK